MPSAVVATTHVLEAMVAVHLLKTPDTASSDSPLPSLKKYVALIVDNAIVG